MNHMKNFFEEFKKFAIKGNVIDLAVAVIIGGAFGKIVTSLVDNIIMPVVGMFLGGVDFSGYAFQAGGAYIKYGSFIQSVVDFTIIAFIIFLAIRTINKMKQNEEKVEPEKPKEPSDEVKLLTEIRDLLQSKQ